MVLAGESSGDSLRFGMDLSSCGVKDGFSGRVPSRDRGKVGSWGTNLGGFLPQDLGFWRW